MHVKHRSVALALVVSVCVGATSANAGGPPPAPAQGATEFVAGLRRGPVVSVGVAKIDTTPDGPIRLCGYASRQTESEGVAQRLWAKALALGSEEADAAVLITVDLVGVPGSLTDQLAEQLKTKAGLSRSRLAVCATHTHTGPCLAGMLPAHFGRPFSPEQQARIDQYTGQLADRLEQVALEALAARRPGRLAWAQGKVAFAVNRRKIKNGKWVGMRPNSDGPVDHALPLLRVTDAAGELRAVLVSYACHCTTYGGKFNRIHGDWAGSAQQMIEARHPGAVAMVAAGCGADANPEPRGIQQGTEVVDRHGKAVADEVDRLLAGPLRPLAGPPTCRFRRIDLPFDHVPTRSEWEQRARKPGRAGYYATTVLAMLDRGGRVPATLSYPVQTWTFGDHLAMVFLAGEVVVDYSLRLKRELGPDRLWVNAYANGLPCYIASKRVIAEGGYEVDESMNAYGRPTRLAPVVEDRIVDAVKQLLPRQFGAARQ